MKSSETRVCWNWVIRKKLSIALLALLHFSLISKAQVNLQEGLVAYYPFNENANNKSGNNNDGVVNGTALTIDKFANSNAAYSFDGVDDFIEIEDKLNFNFSQPITIS